jgi:putative DNA methylase
LLERNLAHWQEEGLVPDMEIEPGYNTDQLIRERGWRYWHQLFNPRQILSSAIFINHTEKTENFKSSIWCFVPDGLQRGTRLCIFDTFPGPGRLPKIAQTFANQALNPLFNYGVRAWPYWETAFVGCKDIYDRQSISKKIKKDVKLIDAKSSTDTAHIWITDPPYADAINYHEITEYFIAWLRKNPPPPFDEWTWDSRRALAIKGTDEDFLRSMVDSYRAMADHMPDNGLQCVMFTHQDTGVWSDMISIFWATGLQVAGAWYIATETSTGQRRGGYVQGTVTLVLRRRLHAQRVLNSVFCRRSAGRFNLRSIP